MVCKTHKIRAYIWRACLLAFIGTFGLSGAAYAQSSSNEPTGNLPPCPSRGSDVTSQIDCVCMPPFGKGSRIGVEGSGPYSWYSNICLSAIHAGAIDREGGEVRIIPRPPQASFKGTLANGVYSTDFGSSAKASFDVEKLLSE